MKNSKRFLGAFLSLICVLSLLLVMPITAEANYTYTANIVVGDVDDASFDKSAITVTDKAGTERSDYSIDLVKRSTASGDLVDYKLVISNLSYKDKISFDANKLVKLGADSKYYVKGMRISGSDDLINPSGNTNVDIQVTADETYVVAYGIGKIIPYKVKYLGENDQALYEEETLYGAEGEVLVVPARHIPDYTPDVVEKKVELVKDTVVIFKYTKLEPTVITENVTKNEVVYVKGDTVYKYEYQYLDSEPQVVTTTNPGQTVTNNRREAGATRTTGNAETTTTIIGGNATGNTADANEAGAGEAGKAGKAGAEDSASTGEGTTTIDDDSVPLAGEDVTSIPENDVPKAGETESSHMTRNLFITLIILIVIVVVTYILVQQKRKATVAHSKKKDNNK